MTEDDLISSFKHSVLQHARKYKNITYICKVFSLSITIYYKWLKRFIQLGYLGSVYKIKRNPRIPNRIKPDKEKIIHNYIIEYPTHGPRRIANELKQQAIKINDIRVYNVLCRK